MNVIQNIDCLLGMKTLPDNSIDCCVTDPPYGIRFMGKKWDYEIPAVAIWEEVYRVLKPGGHILVACGTRTQHRMVCNIEDAGFEIRDVIAWHYGSGFPKSLDISKAIDKSAGVEFNIEAASGVGFMNADGSGGYNATKNKLSRKGESTEAAKQWDGWGTALKPATEFWTLARKPISESTVAANILRWGVGGLNIDACRIPFQSDEDFKSATYGTGTNITGGNYGGGNHTIDNDRKKIEADRKGRFPANLILDGFMAEEMDRQSGKLTSGSKSGKRTSPKTKNTYGKFAIKDELPIQGDYGGASRFFYVAKPSTEERGDSSHATVKPQTLIQYLIKLICPIESGRIILEPFAGSGAHCLAARKLGLDFYAYELGEKECKEANERLVKDLGLFA